MKFEGRFEGREFPLRDPRIALRFDTLVRSHTGAVEAEILNLSSMGFRLRATVELQSGTEITLEVPEMHPVKGVIRWVTGDECGGVFLEAVAL
ncbi:MAG: PilZ domain-containing protein [Sphingomicrobium sp.]